MKQFIHHLVTRGVISVSRCSGRRAFTLMELLVVVVVIGLLVAIALPTYNGAQDKARNASLIANVKTIQIALEQFGVENAGKYPRVSGLFSTVNGVGIRRNLYLPNNQFPLSPWSSVRQAANVSIAAPLVFASQIVTGSAVVKDGERLGRVSGGRVPTAAPRNSLHYGAIAYDYDPNATVYVLYGTGKRNRDAVKACHLSNIQVR